MLHSRAFWTNILSCPQQLHALANESKSRQLPADLEQSQAGGNSGREEDSNVRTIRRLTG